MNKMKIVFICLFAVILFGCSDMNSKSAFVGKVQKSNIAPVGTLSAESIYQLTDTFQTQDNKSVTLPSFAGKPTVVAMIFTHFTYACPRLTADMKNIESKLKGENGKVNFLFFLMITITKIFHFEMAHAICGYAENVKTFMAILIFCM
jgi:protein SCO1/2